MKGRSTECASSYGDEGIFLAVFHKLEDYLIVLLIVLTQPFPEFGL